MRYLQNPDIVVREEPGEVWLFFDLDTNQKRYSNAVSVRVWELCDGTRDLAQIADALCAEIDGASRSDVKEDVRALLEQMAADHFIVRAD